MWSSSAAVWTVKFADILSASAVQLGGVGGAGREEWAGQDHWKLLESLTQRKQVTTPTLVIALHMIEREGQRRCYWDGENPSLRSKEVMPRSINKCYILYVVILLMSVYTAILPEAIYCCLRTCKSVMGMM